METVVTAEYPSLDEVVFESRNKSYGAYLIRKKYDQHIGFSLLITTAICLALVTLSGWWQNGIEIRTKGSPEIPSEMRINREQPLIEKVSLSKGGSVRQVRASHPKLIAQITREEVKDETTRPVETTLSGIIGPVEKDGDDPGPDLTGLETPAGTAIEPKDNNTVHWHVEQMPEFPGGQEALVRFLTKNLRYPQVAQRTGVEGKVFLQFVVANDGTISDVVVIKGISKACDEEAVRVIKAMPAWKPGKQNGNPVAVRFTFPVFFRMSE
jgi:periplasmic protein TonB